MNMEYLQWLQTYQSQARYNVGTGKLFFLFCKTFITPKLSVSFSFLKDMFRVNLHKFTFWCSTKKLQAYIARRGLNFHYTVDLQGSMVQIWRVGL